jgi:hypothetical protein
MLTVLREVDVVGIKMATLLLLHQGGQAQMTGGTPAQNSWVLEQWGFGAAQVTAPLLSDNFVKKPLK